MMIHDVKDDLILQVPDQEPSTYTKYGNKGHIMIIHDVKNYPILQVPGQEPLMYSQVWTLRTGGS